MSNKSIFWGFFFITMGIFIFLNIMDWFIFRISHPSVYLPIILIIFGTIFLKVPKIIKNILAGIAGILLSLYLVTIYVNSVEAIFNFDKIIFNSSSNSDDNVYSNYNDAIDPTIKNATFNFSGGAGKFAFNSSQDFFYDIKSNSDTDNIVVDRPNDSTAIVNYDYADLEIETKTRETLIEMNKEPIWKLNISAGASKMDISLEDLKVENLNIDVGASDTRIKFGKNHPHTKVNINCGAANFHIIIPKDVASSVQSDIALTNMDLSDFKKNSSGVYVTENYYKNANKIDFYIEGALSKVKIERE